MGGSALHQSRCAWAGIDATPRCRPGLVFCDPPHLRRSLPARRPVWTKQQLRLVLVVPTTPQRDVADRGRPVHRVGMDVVKLQEAALRALASPGGNERALPAIAPPYGAF